MFEKYCFEFVGSLDPPKSLDELERGDDKDLMYYVRLSNRLKQLAKLSTLLPPRRSKRSPGEPQKIVQKSFDALWVGKLAAA